MRISLNKWHVTHIPDLIVLANNKNIASAMGDRFPHPYTEDDAKSWLDHVTRPHLYTWAIEMDDQLVGAIILRKPEPQKTYTAILSYWIGEAFWGKGIATEAVRRVIDFGFDQLQLVRIATSVLAWNNASKRVLEKSGFLKEGTLRYSMIKNGKLIDRDIYAVLCEKNLKFYEKDGL